MFIVIAVGAGRGLLLPATLGAVTACTLVLLIGVIIHKPLTRVPENVLKFSIGVMFSPLGAYRTGEGLDVSWPGHDSAIVGFAVIFLGVGVITAATVRWPKTEIAE